MMVVWMLFSFLAAIYRAIQNQGKSSRAKDSLHFLTILINGVAQGGLKTVMFSELK